MDVLQVVDGLRGVCKSYGRKDVKTPAICQPVVANVSDFSESTKISVWKPRNFFELHDARRAELADHYRFQRNLPALRTGIRPQPVAGVKRRPPRKNRR
jgi:hypothetical protein